MARSEKRKRLGQHFLVSNRVVEAEAAHAEGKRVLEIGPGRGILTNALCKVAKNVLAIEKDKELYEYLKYTCRHENLELIHGDFFDICNSLQLSNIDIMISNVPYNASSRIIAWLSENKLEAVLCLQKEFVEHMLAEESQSNYSRLSVLTRLTFKVTEIMDVTKSDFRPVPRVDSKLIYMKPLRHNIDNESIEVIGTIMQHKKKKLRNALIDSRMRLNMNKEKIASILDAVGHADERVFTMSPEELLKIANKIVAELKHS